MSSRLDVCLISSTSIAHNPRLLKEADALSAAGYRVGVIFCQTIDWVARRDEAILRSRNWRASPVSIVPGPPAVRQLQFWRSRLRMHFYQKILSRFTLSYGIAERAFVRPYDELLQAAMRLPARLYIAHNLQALPVAFQAAQHHNAYCAFDAEDYHTGQLPPEQQQTPEQKLIEHIEDRHIRRCVYVSAPSAGIAQALAQRYGIAQPLVIHNVFPWRDREMLDGQVRDRRGPELSLFWYSQTVGLDRGLQDAIRAVGLLSEPPQIHIRGVLAAEVREQLLHCAREVGIAGKIYFHEMVPPNELLSRIAEHDVGLALEPGYAHSMNNALTVSNKLFHYFLAGLAVAATDVPGQKQIMEQTPQAGCRYRPGDYQALARCLQGWLDQPEQLAGCKQAALEAARQRWNWEREQQLFLDQIRSVIGMPA